MRKEDPAFAAAWDSAIEDGTDLLEDEARRRALEGVEELIVTMGKIARNDDGTPLLVRRLSDTLMLALLKARRPEKYRERVSAEHSGPSGKPLMVANFHLLAKDPATSSRLYQELMAAPIIEAPNGADLASTGVGS